MNFADKHLRDERNVLVYGQRGDTMAAAVLVAFLIKYDLLEVEVMTSESHPCFFLA